jgi:WD40 repeat protein
VQFARLSGHTSSVRSVDMSKWLVVTASLDTTVRVYNTDRGYLCTAVLDWIHADWVLSVAVIGDDLIFSASRDSTVCIAQPLSDTVVARTELSYGIFSAACLADGRLAVCGDGGNAVFINAPAAATDILRAHGATEFPGAAAAASALAVAEPLTPLQDAYFM